MGELAAGQFGVVSAAQLRREFVPLNPPPAQASSILQEAARQASTAAFHLAMLVSAALLLAGAAVNGVGIQAPAASKARRPVSADPLWRKCRHLS